MISSTIVPLGIGSMSGIPIQLVMLTMIGDDDDDDDEEEEDDEDDEDDDDR